MNDPYADLFDIVPNEDTDFDLEEEILAYKRMKPYLFFIKHLIKINGLWDVFCSIACWEWDCFPSDLEESFLFEGLSSVGINV